MVSGVCFENQVDSTIIYSTIEIWAGLRVSPYFFTKRNVMGRKTKRQLVRDQLDEALTIGQLVELLKDMPQDVYVGRVGHFGEANLMNKYDFSSGNIRKAYIMPSGLWRDGDEYQIDMLNIQVPDIGPDPD